MGRNIKSNQGGSRRYSRKENFEQVRAQRRVKSPSKHPGEDCKGQDDEKMGGVEGEEKKKCKLQKVKEDENKTKKIRKDNKNPFRSEHKKVNLFFLDNLGIGRKKMLNKLWKKWNIERKKQDKQSIIDEVSESHQLKQQIECQQSNKNTKLAQSERQIKMNKKGIFFIKSYIQTLQSSQKQQIIQKLRLIKDSYLEKKYLKSGQIILEYLKKHSEIAIDIVEKGQLIQEDVERYITQNGYNEDILKEANQFHEWLNDNSNQAANQTSYQKKEQPKYQSHQPLLHMQSQYQTPILPPFNDPDPSSFQESGDSFELRTGESNEIWVYNLGMREDFSVDFLATRLQEDIDCDQNEKYMDCYYENGSSLNHRQWREEDFMETD